MDYQKKFFNLLTICEKAGKITKGFDISKEAVINKKAEYLMLAADISPKTEKEAEYLKAKNSWLKIIKLPYTMDEIQNSIGKKVGVMAVCDKGFASKLSEYAATHNTETK